MDVKDNKTLEPEVDVGTAADVEEVMKKYDRESNVRVWEGMPKTIVRMLSIIFSVYCIWVTLFSVAIPEVKLNVFLGSILILGYLNFPIRKGITKVNHMPWYDILIMVAGAFPFFYFAYHAKDIIKLATRVTKDPFMVAIAIIVVANIWGKGMVKIIPILLGVVGSYIVALIAGKVDFTEVGGANFVGLQHFVLAKFDLTAILVMAPIAIAAMMEHIGDMSAISSTTGKNFIADPGLHRTLLGDGLATMVAGMFGGPANTTYGENTGVLALSRVYDPRVIRLAALYAIILSFSPKFDALVNSIPTAIVGGVSFILYGMISAVGVRNVVENKVDLTKSRNLIIAAVIFVSGLGFSSTGGITFTVGGADVTLTGLAIAALAGVILNAILPGNDYKFGVDPQGDKSADLGSY